MRNDLTPGQRAILSAIGVGELQSFVYFTGGTLLASRYLHHRRSLDVDIFSEELLDDVLVTRAIRAVVKSVGATNARHVRYPSRWQYFLTVGNEEVKCDVVYFPFPALGKRMRLPEFNLLADSLRDIAANKIHACHERAAVRDAFDLYLICTKKQWTIPALIADVERKFSISIDPVHFIARAQTALDQLDDMRPLFIGKPPPLAAMRAFFDNTARRHLRRVLR